jgi:diguanylate cyclase (GGDEF)-like protein/PAS domain S-box-containing protein
MKKSPEENLEKKFPPYHKIKEEEEFKSIIKNTEIQELVDDFYSLTKMGMAITDLEGNILISTGWQDICAKFHRVNEKSRKNCTESDLYLSKNIKPGSCSMYKCKNNMWDAVTPIIVGSKHVGNLFFGQFFFDDEAIDRKVFEDQAEKLGFDKVEYLAALDKVLRWSKIRIKTVMNFYLKFAQLISSLSLSNLNLTKTLSDYEKAVETLRESEEKYRLLIENSHDIIYTLDLKGVFTFVSPGWTLILGHPTNQIIGRPFQQFVYPDDIEPCETFMKKTLETKQSQTNIEYRVRHIDGSWHWNKTNAMPLLDKTGTVIGFEGIASDITESKNKEAKILHLSYHDKLTEVYNRRFFEEEIKRLNTNRQLPLSIIMGDLNGLKIINDTFGHNEGDILLKKTAGLLKKICRSDDILARWGGDEFVILLPKTSILGSENIAQRIKKGCDKLVFKKIPLSLAIGIATKTKMLQNLDKIIIEAESNMYKNKLAQKESSASSIISALEQTLYEKSSETMEHALRIKDNAIKLGKSIKLHPHQFDALSLLASLHDIGKVAIPESILLKKGKLTEKEWSVIKKHPEIGFNIAQSSPQINHIAKFILSCHENWDGSGYPMGLSGESIPVISRIIFIADAYDVMTSERIYKKTMSKYDAIKELRRCAGTQFDPVLVEKFIKIISK